MLTEFYFEIQYFVILTKNYNHLFIVTETLNSDKSDSVQCYSVRINNSALFTFMIHHLFQHSSQLEYSP